jgi:hypothetical protein
MELTQPTTPQPPPPSDAGSQDPLAAIAGTMGGPPPAEGAGPQQPQIVFDEKRHGDALLRLLELYEAEDFETRLQDARNVRKARSFWKGDQYLWYDEVSKGFQTLSGTFGLKSQEDIDNVYQYVTNIFQGYGLTFMSVISQNPPTVRFWPQDPRNPDDTATAEAASDVSELIARNNEMDASLVDQGFYLWCDGAFGGYVRYVSDSEAYGETKIPVMQEKEQQLTPDQATCACGYAADLPDGTDPMMTPPCPLCGSPTTIMPGERAMIPVPSGQVESVPNGQEVIDIVGKLELRVPSYAKRLKDCPYLEYVTEVPKAKLKTTYPDKASQLAKGVEGSAGDTEERNIRVNLTSDRRSGASKQGDSLLTFKRTWFRPWAFALLPTSDDVIAKELIQLFPSGCFMASVGKVLCEARAESMDDHWRVCFAYPGDGSIRPSVGGSLISVQERYNTLANIEVETHEHGIPTTFVEEDSMNFQAWQDEGNSPGLTFPMRARTGLPIQANLFQTEPAPVSPQLVAHREELMGPVAQFLTGLFPALFGGGALGNDTAAGYAMQRDQAMGRIGLLWRNLKTFNAGIMELSVEVFRKNRKGEVAIASLASLGDVESKMIHLENLRGKFFAYPETNEDFPMTWTQKRNTLQDLMNSPLVNVLQTPANMEAVGRVLGPIGLEFPGADARVQQMREIGDMLLAQPTMPQPMPGQMVDPAQMQAMAQPSVQVDPDLDDHTTHMMAIQEWAASPAGRKAREDNPEGFLNVKLHFQQHQMVAAQQQAAQAAAQATAEGGQATPSEGQPPKEASA